ncbi:DUF6478 family protein [Paracoccus sp. (in: a-proteobacteria)]|uniref:DUF6478 family protein n=1 Tax=Paracoccus sp. TaxID=267 RepID=UPI003A865F83
MNAIRLNSLLARPLRERAARQWSTISRSLRDGIRPSDPELRDEAEALHRDLSSFLQLTDPRAIRIRAALADMNLPLGTDWRWRPGMFCGPIAPSALVEPRNGQRLGHEVAVWHDCAHRALILRQRRNRRSTDLAPFGMSLEVMGFSGSYLSLSLDLPETVLEGLGTSHILRLETVLQAERPVTVYGRLNLLHGPNTAQMLRQLGDPISDQTCHRVIEFDLAYAELTERRIEKVWLDLIFEAPHMNGVELGDVVLSRHMRAEI